VSRCKFLLKAISSVARLPCSSSYEDEPHLKRIILSVVRRVQLEVPVLVFRDELNTVLERNVDVGRDAPLCVERRIPRAEPVIAKTGCNILVERVGAFGEGTLAVELVAIGVGIPPVVEASLRENVLAQRIRCIRRIPVEVVAERSRRKILQPTVSKAMERSLTKTPFT
jgi:hypothetical protein